MYKIKVENNVYDCPSAWSEINLSQFMGITNLNDELSTISKTVKILSIITDIPEDVMLEIDITSLMEIDFSWLNEKIDTSQISKEIMIDDDIYVVADFNKMTLGEYVDVEEFVNDYIHNLHKIVAVIVRKSVDGKIEKYDGNTVMERAELFKEKMNIVDLVSISNFFLGLNNQK